MIEDGRPPAIYDVRSTDDFAARHVPGAVHARGASAVTLACGMNRGNLVVMVCDDGCRSREIAEAASKRCARPIAWLEGGMAAWSLDRPRLSVRVVDDLRIRGEAPAPRTARRAAAPRHGALGIVASWFNLPVALAALAGTAVVVAAVVRLCMWD